MNLDKALVIKVANNYEHKLSDDIVSFFKRGEGSESSIVFQEYQDKKNELFAEIYAQSQLRKEITLSSLMREYKKAVVETMDYMKEEVNVKEDYYDKTAIIIAFAFVNRLKEAIQVAEKKGNEEQLDGIQSIISNESLLSQKFEQVNKAQRNLPFRSVLIWSAKQSDVVKWIDFDIDNLANPELLDMFYKNEQKENHRIDEQLK